MVKIKIASYHWVPTVSGTNLVGTVTLVVERCTSDAPCRVASEDNKYYYFVKLSQNSEWVLQNCEMKKGAKKILQY